MEEQLWAEKQEYGIYPRMRRVAFGMSISLTNYGMGSKVSRIDRLKSEL